jgi:hypothetical protein
MKYGMVRQFSNNAIDNFFNFFYKISDFGKVALDLFLSFFEIWTTFFSIFYNIFMYIYYFILFAIEIMSQSGFFFWRKTIKVSKAAPAITIPTGPSPIPHMYRVKTAAATFSSATDSAKTVLSSIKPASMQKKSLLIKIVEFFTDFFDGIKKFFLKFASGVINIFNKNIKQIKESEKDNTKAKSLIDEYMKEYERKKR